MNRIIGFSRSYEKDVVSDSSIMKYCTVNGLVFHESQMRVFKVWVFIHPCLLGFITRFIITSLYLVVVSGIIVLARSRGTRTGRKHKFYSTEPFAHRPGLVQSC